MSGWHLYHDSACAPSVFYHPTEIPNTSSHTIEMYKWLFYSYDDPVSSKYEAYEFRDYCLDTGNITDNEMLILSLKSGVDAKVLREGIEFLGKLGSKV